MKLLRLYIDTSVFGGCLDEEFSRESNILLDAARNQKVVLVISEVVLAELRRAPKKVQDLVNSLPDESIEILEESLSVTDLTKAYLHAKVVPARSKNDAKHVAHATVARTDAIVSWNFRDIVRLDRIRGFNNVNFENGFGVIQIISPKEVLFYET